MSPHSARPSRRTFLSGAVAGTAYFWIPKPVKGYTAAEMAGFVVDQLVKPGISKWDLDTPALVVDLDRLEANLGRWQRYCEPLRRAPSDPGQSDRRPPADRRAQALPVGARVLLNRTLCERGYRG